MTIILSASSISTYLTCHYRYALSNIYRVPGGQSLAAALGSAVHAGAEAVWTSPKRPETVMRAVWEQELALVPLPYDEPPDGVYADAEKMLQTYKSKVVPTFRPTMVEERFVATVDSLEGVLLTGTLDAADDDVHDLKTTAGKTINGRTPHFYPESYDLQLSLYRLGYRALTGKWPGRLFLDLLTRRGTYRRYEREPKTQDLLDAVSVVRDGILQEDYKPTGATGGACHYCPYKEICRFAIVS